MEHEVFTVAKARQQVSGIGLWGAVLRTPSDTASVYPRAVVMSAIQHNVAACILHHNYPSGDSKSSQVDQAIAARVKEALNVIKMRRYHLHLLEINIQVI